MNILFRIFLKIVARKNDFISTNIYLEHRCFQRSQHNKHNNQKEHPIGGKTKSHHQILP